MYDIDFLLSKATNARNLIASIAQLDAGHATLPNAPNPAQPTVHLQTGD